MNKVIATEAELRQAGIVDVTFGKSVTVVQPVNLYGCERTDEAIVTYFAAIKVDGLHDSYILTKRNVNDPRLRDLRRGHKVSNDRSHSVVSITSKALRTASASQQVHRQPSLSQ